MKKVCKREYCQDVEKARQWISQSEAVVIGAGSGLSAAAGLTYSGERFEQYFHEYIEKYGMQDMYTAGFYPFATQEEKWAYWSRHIYYNRYDQKPGKTYLNLLELVKKQNYFVLTTNVDYQFWIAGFDPERIFATQGDYGKLQCAKACHNTLYDNEEIIRKMIAVQKGCRVPEELVPRCPVCGGAMEVNLRCDEFFVEDLVWHEAAKRYQDFLQENKSKRMIFLELGVGMNTPGIIKYPFWNMTKQWKDTSYICVNKGEAWVPQYIKTKAICINEDISKVLSDMTLNR